MNIPNKFVLGGTTWRVKEQASISNAPTAMGITSNMTATVDIMAGLPKDVKEQTFCHELVHAILFSMGKPGDQHDETFVDGFATFLHQYLKQVK